MNSLTQKSEEIKTLMDSKEIIIHMGNLIRKKRKELQLTIKELSENLNISAGVLKFIELGYRRISFENMFKIANFFNISIDELVGFKHMKENNNLNQYDTNFNKFIKFAKQLDTQELNFFIAVIKAYIKMKCKY